MKKRILLVLLLLTSCIKDPNPEQGYKIYSQTTFSVGFDTSFQLIGETASQEEFVKYYEMMINEGQYFNKVFDRYNDYPNTNNIKTINENAGIKAVPVDKPVIDLILMAKTWSEKTDYAFDITIGAVADIWHEYREIGKIRNNQGESYPSPSQKELQAASQYIGYKYVEIDEVNSTVYLTHPSVRLDVGAIAKGYAVEKIAETLVAAGLESGVLNGGGNIKILGPKRNGDNWGFELDNPNKPVFSDSSDKLDILRTTLPLSLVTSGDYQRYYIDDNNIRQHHIINPKTLFPNQDKRAVIIMHQDSGVADILSTALFVNSIKWGIDFINQFNENHPDEPIYVIWVTSEKPHEFDSTTLRKFQDLHLTYSNNILPLSKHFSP